MTKNKNLWLLLAKNFVIAVVLSAILMLAIWLLKIEIVIDNVLICSVLATISGIAYLLTIRNTANYTGFYSGIFSSACLGVQFALLGGYDLTFLYFAVFIPFQYAAIVNWKKKEAQTKNEIETFRPKFLPFKKQLFFFSIFLIIIVIDYIFSAIIIKNQPFFDDFLRKTMFATMISSSILANYLMINKWLDTWLYWLLYSVSAIFSAIIIQNNFNLLLFVFFLIINIITFISWLKIKK